MIGLILVAISMFFALMFSITAPLESMSGNKKQSEKDSIVGVISILVCIIFLCIIVYGNNTAKYYQTGEYNLVALQDNRGVEGRASRYYGRISSTQDITLAVGTEENFVIWNLNANTCNIYQGDFQPRITVYTLFSWKDTILYPIFGIEFIYKKYDIYVPKGTLVSDFNLDLQ